MHLAALIQHRLGVRSSVHRGLLFAAVEPLAPACERSRLILQLGLGSRPGGGHEWSSANVLVPDVRALVSLERVVWGGMSGPCAGAGIPPHPVMPPLGAARLFGADSRGLGRTVSPWGWASLLAPARLLEWMQPESRVGLGGR